MGILTIRRTLAHGWRTGFATGLGVAAADGIYASFAAFGLTLLTQTLISLRPIIGTAGGLALIYLGIKSLRSAGRARAIPTAEAPDVRADEARVTAASAFISALGLGVTNPATILLFAAVFAGAGLANESGDPLCAAALVAGVVGGSALWWLLLTGGTSFFRHRLKAGALRWIDRLSGLVLIGFGAAALLSAL